MFRHLSVFAEHPTARAISGVFFINCFLFSSWIAHLPEVKSHLQLSDGLLGICLFAFPLGAMAINSQTSRLVSYFGEQNLCFITATTLAFLMLFPVVVPTPFLLFLILFLLGITMAVMNVAMNATASTYEKQNDVLIISACHGFWSVGGILGSLGAAFWLSGQWSSVLHMAAASMVSLGLIIIIRPYLLRMRPQAPVARTLKSGMAPLNRTMVYMILVGMGISTAEGLALDWSAVYLNDVANAGANVAALGYASFSIAMAFGRLSGDGLIPKIGADNIIVFGSLLASSGLLLAILVPTPVLSLLGFLMLGMGIAIAMPILYMTSMRIKGIAPASGLATFVTYSTVGFLAGPPIIGAVSEWLGLKGGLAFVATNLLIGASIARLKLRPLLKTL